MQAGGEGGVVSLGHCIAGVAHATADEQVKAVTAAIRSLAAVLGPEATFTASFSGSGPSPAKVRGREYEPLDRPPGWLSGQSLKGLWVFPGCSFSVTRSSPFISCSGWYT